jgi:hypothetical protein
VGERMYIRKRGKGFWRLWTWTKELITKTTGYVMLLEQWPQLCITSTVKLSSWRAKTKKKKKKSHRYLWRRQ